MSRTRVVKVVRQRTRQSAPVLLPVAAPRYLAIEDVCDWLGITDKTLRVWRHRHGFPTIAVDGWIRFDRDSVAAWLAAHETRDAAQDAA